ncbi:hypothetical protein [Thermocrinis minervae]|uniref:hypothetical protein n=1 Tax=Thermocrinis minervae TaxID=381751 RepID=UPI00155FDA49|nr:hypothetical protein [Thermocrinis minervae]
MYARQLGEVSDSGRLRQVEVYSAGSNPAGYVHTLAIPGHEGRWYGASQTNF